jgi:carbon monoxide dehydrogenase subunit G
MATFTSTRRDVADVPHEVDAVWELLVDPDAVARLTPLVKSIEVDGGGRWLWTLQRVPVSGRRFDLTMTEEMTFTPKRRIEFTHGPLGDGIRAGADGHYLLQPVDGGTRLSIEITVTAQLPLPRLTGAAVRVVMHQVLTHMGDRFADNMLAELAGREPRSGP